MGQNQWVVKHGKQWAVKGEGNSHPTSIHNKQSNAIGLARQIAKSQQSELFIQGRDGKIRDRDSFGNDPFPPRDRKH
jgi:hypothetical protein